MSDHENLPVQCHARGDVGGTLTPITYYPVPMQEQLQENARAVADKPYGDVFDPDLTVPLDWAKSLQLGPMPLEQTITPGVADIARYVADPGQYPDSGYAVLDGPTAYVQKRMLMPNVTTEMFRWWFTWFQLEKERFTLWFPQAHIVNRPEDPARLADTSLSFEERLYGNPNYVEEYIGAFKLPVYIHFTHPEELGVDPEALKRNGLTTSASGTLRIATSPDVTAGLMLHLARDTDAGLELFSRYWIGAHPELQRFKGADGIGPLLKQMHLDEEGAKVLAYELAVHDMSEFNHLARILPTLYARFGGRG